VASQVLVGAARNAEVGPVKSMTGHYGKGGKKSMYGKKSMSKR
jgi:hypothetical protein